jgi:hypothetical protein
VFYETTRLSAGLRLAPAAVSCSNIRAVKEDDTVLRNVIPFRAAAKAPLTTRTPDVAFHALPLLGQLRDKLEQAAAAHSGRNRWGVPRLFFFNKAAQTEWEADERYRVPSQRATLPDETTDLLADALTLLAGSIEVRRTARTIPRLRNVAEALAPNVPACRQLAGMLAIADDWTGIVLHPAARAGFRVRLRGVADLFQFHVLLADTIIGPVRGLLPGPRLDERVVEAYRGADVDPAADVATARFQMYRPSALRSDGTLPTGFQGVDDWLWGHESPADIPAVNGERVLLLGEPPYPRRWPVGRRFSLVRGELDLLDVLSATAVERWLDTLAGASLVGKPDLVRRAA